MIRKIVTTLGVFAVVTSTILVSGCADKKAPEDEAAAEAAAAESSAEAGAGGADTAAADLGEEDIPMGNMSTVDSQGRVRKDVLSANDSAMEASAGSEGSESGLLVPAALFAFDSSTLDSSARATLDEVAALLSKNGSWIVTLEGHCDERGTEEYNLGLGQRRAESAKRYLLQKGISSSRIDTVSFGEAYPVDARSNEAAWAKNRRVHFAFAKGSAS